MRWMLAELSPSEVAMSNQVPSDSSWGEDIYSLAISKVLGDSPVVKRLEDAISARYRREIRNSFETDESVISILAGVEDPKSVHEEVCQALAKSAREGTEYLFEQTVGELLDELRQLKKNNPSLYLVDEATGKLVLPLRPGAIYQPPPYKDENGQIHKSRPILHPGISAPLAETKTNADRESVALANPAPVYDHLRSPEAMVERAKEKLHEMGFDATENEGTQHEVMAFGREYHDGALQSPNPMFHRVEAFGGALARQVARFLRENQITGFRLSSPTLKQNSKWRWYEVSVYYA